MEHIVSISKSPKKLEIKISNNQWAIIHLWGNTYYTEVSDLILKSSIRPIALDFLRQKDKIKTEKYVNLELKTVFD